MFNWINAMLPWNWKWVRSLLKKPPTTPEPIRVSQDWNTSFLVTNIPTTPDPTQTASEVTNVEKKQPQPYSLTAVAITLFAVLAALFALNVVLFFVFPGNMRGVRVWHVAFVLECVYFFSSLRKVPESKIGSIILFGNPVYNVSSGLAFVPLFISELLIAQQPAIQHELPTEPHLIWRGEGTLPADLAAQGWREPLRAVFKRSDSEDRGPLEEQLTTEYKVVSTWHIRDLCRFIGKVGSIEDGKKRIEDVVIAFCSDRLAKSTLLASLSSLAQLSEELEKKVEALVADWGVEVETVQLKEIPLSHSLNTAIQTASVEAGKARGKVAEAKGTKASRILVAEGEKEATILQGQGDGDGEKARLTGTTQGLAAMQVALNLKPELVLSAHVAKSVASHDGQTFVFGAQGFGEMLTLASTITSAKAVQNQNQSSGN